MASATLTSKGQVTLPKKVRDHLGLQPNDRIDFVIDERGGVAVRPVRRDVSELYGILHRPGRRAVTLEEMDAAIARRHRRRP